MPADTMTLPLKAPAGALVIFGASGDLTKRLLMPALYNLAANGLLDEDFQVIGVARSVLTSEAFRATQMEFLETFLNKSGETLDTSVWSWLEQRLHYMAGSNSDPATAEQIAELIGDGNATFFMAVPSESFVPLIDFLNDAGLMRQTAGHSRRLIVEKPFGHNLTSAVALNAKLLGMFEEEQVYRIDHFLGKETVQNIMALRFANSMFEPLWNNKHIASVQITAAETVGVEGRGGFYEPTGALRDMVPNHLFQLLALTAMEAPVDLGPDAIHTAKATLLEAIEPLSEDMLATRVVRGQYGAGFLNDMDVTAYVDDVTVSKDSQTETYIALQLMIENPRWQGVPFYVRTGKHLAARSTEIVITFHPLPHQLAGGDVPNILHIRLQPNEGAALTVNNKQLGQGFMLQPVALNFNYKDVFALRPSTGYESLLYDVLTGNPTLYSRADAIEAGWRKVEPILEAAACGKIPLHMYAAGSEGPAAADSMLADNGDAWRKLV